MDVLGNNKLIFIFGSVTQPPPYRLQKGEQFLLGLLKHNLRISVEGSCSDIDHNKSACNLLRLSDTERWTTAVSHEGKNNYFCQVKKKYHQILKKFQQQLQAQNVVYQQRSQYDQIKTWKHYTSNKNITGEWIVSASRNWFVRNRMIKLDQQRHFVVVNSTKLYSWANLVYDWGSSKIQKLYHPQAFIGAFLHLDETNVHIHLVHLQFMHKFNYLQNKKVYTFTKPRILTPTYLSKMRSSLRKYLNQALAHQWTSDDFHLLTPSYHPKKYLDLYQLKVKHLQQQIRDYQQQLIQIKNHQKLLTGLQAHHFHLDLLKTIRVLDLNTKQQLFLSLIKFGYARDFLQQQLLFYDVKNNNNILQREYHLIKVPKIR